MNNQKMKIGMGQLLIEGGEPERNFQRATQMIRQASEQQCDLVLLPECLDFAWTHPSAKMEAQPIPGHYSSLLCQEANAQQIYICAGLTEKEGIRVYNSAVLINRVGEIILKYRKINLLIVEQEFYAVGNCLSVVETPFGIIGINICSDNYADSLTIGHTLARMGAQVILSPSSWTVGYSLTEEEDPYGNKWIQPYTTLAQLYNLVIVGATSVGIIVGGPYEGKKMIGCSLAVSPNGIITQGPYNEFAGELIVTEFSVPMRKEKGTAISNMLLKKGYCFDRELMNL